MEDDPLLFSASIDELEFHETDTSGKNHEHPLVFAGEAWLGRDLHKLWMKAEGEYFDGHTESTEAQVLYNRAATPFWDIQIGMRRDSHGGVERDWAVIGFHGTAPYLIETETALFIGEDGRSALRVKAGYEMPFTQRLILGSEVELNFHGKDDPLRGIRTGLSDVEAGLRVRYEIRREFAPYIGVSWEKLVGGTADLARFRGQASEETGVVIGIKAWF
ncbi:MAG TPA: copper resistance protein B [Gammaproteobacteria bacterium]